MVSIGGGPAGLYFGILMKKNFPEIEYAVYERNRADDTFGFGVVFSDDTLNNFERSDAKTYQNIRDQFRYWRDIETFYRGTRTVSTGHGFSALSRQRLLLILQERCRELGVEFHFETEIDSLEPFLDVDLILGADGVNSWVRQQYADTFKPSIDWRKCRFCWLGTDKPLDAFTFIFEETPHGVFQVHAYPFEDGLGTWIVECSEETFERAGIGEFTEEQTAAFCEELFAEHLDGHRLFTNRSLWRRFPTVRCETWIHDNVLLFGDAAHTAHFSIGSGTKLAMEDAQLLSELFVREGLADVRHVLATYEDERWVDLLKLQKAAQTSLEWFENSARYMGQPPAQFTFNLMTRSKRITYDNLKERDPALIAAVDREFANAAGFVASEAPRLATTTPPAPIFVPYRVGELEVVNRIVVSPMCQYSATDGVVDDWHLVHLGSRAIGGAGLIITEMTDVMADGRIAPGCAGLYTDQHVTAWRRITDFVHAHSQAKVGLQLAHAGRKGSVRHPWSGDDVPLLESEGAWQTIAPSAIPFYPDWPVPREMTAADLVAVREAFVQAAERAVDAGFDLIELHMAHGYLLSGFLSPLSNQRADEYGGSLENRLRYPLEVLRAVRAVWPSERPIAVRISATDWMPDGTGVTADDAVAISRALCSEGCDLIDVSSAGNVPESEVGYGRMYQVPFADKIRAEAGVPVMAVGAILGADHANTVVAAGRADLAAMARPHLRDAYLTLHAAETYEHWQQHWPGQYFHGQPQPPRERPGKPKP